MRSGRTTPWRLRPAASAQVPTEYHARLSRPRLACRIRSPKNLYRDPPLSVPNPNPNEFMRHSHSPLRAVLFVTAFFLASVARAQVAVIVSPNSATARMTAEQVSDIFLGKTQALPGVSGAVQPVNLTEGDPLRDQFYAKVAGKNPAQVKAIWSKIVFTGKASLPREMASAEDVKKFVATNPNVIGYIPQSAVDARVKVVFSID